MTGSIRNKILVVFYLSSVLSLLGYILIYLLSQQQGELVAVSYTHLTLPTNREV